MDHLITVLDKIHDAIGSAELDLDVSLPQIAVVGGQSVGKSSVLEGLVGRAFLPTGTGIVTRRPLVLRLEHTRPEASDREWGEFQHLPEQELEDFAAIRDEIRRETERVCGSQQIVSSEPIVLKISSPRVVDLTLVDLPGLARVPIGDQPQDIERLIRELIMKYISNPRCIILGIVAGNADLATADALALAREVDPEGNRTIGVVTKLDLMDPGVDALAVLDGRAYPLKQGFIGIVCRSFRDVEVNRDLEDKMLSADQWFRSHPAYRCIAERCGVSFLAKYLNQLLISHISSTLPGIFSLVQELVHKYEAELQSYGEHMSTQTSDPGVFLLGLFTKFAVHFGDAVEGKISGRQDTSLLVGRARIDYIFREVFGRTVLEFDCFQGLSDGEIRAAIQNATGPRASLFVPEAAFELLAKRQILRLEAPSLQCAELCFEELQRIVLIADLPEFQRFVNLRVKIFGVVRDILRKSLEPTSEMIRSIVQIELAYINTNHPDFIGGAGAMRVAATNRGVAGVAGVPSDLPPEPCNALSTASAAASSPASAPSDPPSSGSFSFAKKVFGFGQSLPKAATAPNILATVSPATTEDASRLTAANGTTGITNSSMACSGARAPSPPPLSSGSAFKLSQVPQVIMPASTPPTNRERVEVEIVRSLLANYLSIVKKNIADSVPKVIMSFMINTVKDAVQRECIARLYKEELFDTLLQEASDIQGRRRRCQERLKALYRAVEALEQAREYVDV